jgi:PAS domain S-box-containing protein
MDAILVLDAASLVVECNPAAEEMFGLSESQLVGRPMGALLLPGDDGDVLATTELNGDGGRLVGLRASGETFPAEASKARAAASGLSMVVIRDVTERLAQAEEIARLNRLYASLSAVNQAIVTASEPQQLFQRICDALVERGGFRMAWVGVVSGDETELVPTAHSGDVHGYTSHIRIPLLPDPDALGRGPSGTAIHLGRPYICNDLLTDPATLPWRAGIEQSGFMSSAAFPVRIGGEVRGALSVYSAQRGFFRDAEVALLEEAAGDLSFALDMLEGRAEHARAEAAAERERAFAQSLVESLPGILYLYDETGRFLRWNSRFEQVTGRSTEAMAALRPLDLFEGDEVPLLRERIAEVFERGEASVEATLISKDGSRTPFYFTGRRIDFEGQTCLLGVGLDITQRKQAELELRRSEERFRSTLDGALESCQLIDFDWRYLYLNPAAASHNRRPNAELLGKRMPEAWPGIEGSHVFGMLARCMTERIAVHEETEFSFADGTSAWFDVRAQPVPEGIFVLSIDISERKHAEHALREMNESLEQIVRVRTADLEVARDRAEAADRIKSAFLATMSHELRTPLNSILGFTGVLLQGLAGPLNGEQSKQLGMVQASGRHLLALINDVLDISKIEAGQLEMHRAPFDLRATAERAAEAIRPLAEKKAITLRVRIDPGVGAIDSDARRVQQILLNLLSNAVKFTDRGSVELAVELVRSSDHPAVRLRVTDTGIGIREGGVAELFQPFRQLDSGLQRQHEGTGLGLAISRRLAALLGGTIEAESTWGRGSVFTVTLPLSEVPAIASTTSSEASEP